MLPNLIVIGAGKAGTTSLYHYLGLHPEIYMSRDKELRFFHSDFNWDKGIDWYEAQFANGSAPVRGEASPQYTHYPRSPETAERMHSVVPDAKLIYIVRDPIERIISDYTHSWVRGRQQRSLASAVAQPERSVFVQRSSYGMQLDQYLPYYPLDRILVLSHDELLEDRRGTLRRVFRFLEVDDRFDSPGFDQLSNATTDKRRVEGQPRWLKLDPEPVGHSRLPWMFRLRVKRLLYRPFLKPVERVSLDDEVREELIAYLRPDIERFRKITGMAFEGWSV